MFLCMKIPDGQIHVHFLFVQQQNFLYSEFKINSNGKLNIIKSI